MCRCRAALALLLAVMPTAVVVVACAGPRLANPVRLTLRNRTGASVAGVLIRFDREIATVDATDGDVLAFRRRRLRHHPADTLRLDQGTLSSGEAVSYVVAGRSGPPRVLEARWLIGGHDDAGSGTPRMGPRIGESELTLR